MPVYELGPRETVGVVIVDHGSRRPESNEQLEAVVARFREQTGHTLVEPAHMELAEPTLASAFDRCVAQGATVVVVHPYFLAPGRHSQEDIPALAALAAARHPGVRCFVTAPLGLHPRLIDVIDERIRETLRLELR